MKCFVFFFKVKSEQFLWFELGFTGLVKPKKKLPWYYHGKTEFKPKKVLRFYFKKENKTFHGLSES